MTTPYTLPEPFLTLQGKSKGKLTSEVMNLFDGPAMSRAYADGFAAGAASRDDILIQALVALSLYAQEDDVIESMEGNEYWVEIKRSAESVIEEIKKVLTP